MSWARIRITIIIHRVVFGGEVEWVVEVLLFSPMR